MIHSVLIEVLPEMDRQLLIARSEQRLQYMVDQEFPEVLIHTEFLHLMALCSVNGQIGKVGSC